MSVDLFAAAKVASVLFGMLSIGAFALALRRFLATIVGPHGYASRRTELAWACGVLAFACSARTPTSRPSRTARRSLGRDGHAERGRLGVPGPGMLAAC